MFESCWPCTLAMARDVVAGLLVLAIGLIQLETGWLGFLHFAAASWLLFTVGRSIYFYLAEGGCHCNEDPE